MTKEQLIALGLTDEQAADVATASATELAGFKPKADYDTAEAARASLQTQFANVETLLKGLVKDAKGSTLEEQITAFQQGIEADKTTAATQLEALRFDHALEKALTASGARNVQAVCALLKQDNIKLNPDGSVTGLEEQVKTLRDSDAYLFIDGDAGKGTGGEGNYARRTDGNTPESTGERLAKAQNATAATTESPYFK